MNITYLTEMKNNPTLDGFTNRPLSMAQIQQLEDLYNAGNPFPKVLRELLYLAGEFCNVVGLGHDFQSVLGNQQLARDLISHYNMDFPRPFYAFDFVNGEQFCFVYLDEEEDPWVYYAYPGGITDDAEVLGKTYYNLSNYINKGIELAKQGYNPY